MRSAHYSRIAGCGSLYRPLVHRASGKLIGYEALPRAPEGHALERPDLLFAAARQEGRLAELDWLCRATAFDGAVTGGLRPPTALLSTPRQTSSTRRCRPSTRPRCDRRPGTSRCSTR